MMTDPTARDEHVMTLAAEALKTPVSGRDSFLQSQCQNDPELYREVSEVVAWEERMHGFLDRALVEFIDLEALERVFKPGETVSGRFEILRCVGDGGMGVVYEAFDYKRKQRIAIKLAKPGFGRLLSPELEGALKVRHPNVCAVNEIHSTATELGELDFLTMEFLDGETLVHRLAQGKLDQVEALEIARQLCAGVAEAHRSGILHRDLKPGNVILCRKKDGSLRAVITDFGLSAEGAVAGEVGGGTPSYMAPELLRGGKPSQASDVFSLGVVLYEMVTGQKPFPATADGNGAVRTPIPPTRLVKNLPVRWDKAILPGLREVPEERCAALEMLHALEHKPFYRRLGLLRRPSANRIPKNMALSAPERSLRHKAGAFAGLADVQEVLVDYVETTGGVTVTPCQVDKGATVRFRNPKGYKMRIVFLSPEGNEADTVLDSDTCTMIVGGIYHFLCFFTPPGASNAIHAKTGGVLEVYPPRP